MMADKITDFKKDIANYWHCEGRDGESGTMLLSALRNPRHPINEEEFAQFLKDAILNKTISVNEYEVLTSLDFESESEVAADLHDLWRMMYGDFSIRS